MTRTLFVLALLALVLPAAAQAPADSLSSHQRAARSVLIMEGWPAMWLDANALDVESLILEDPALEASRERLEAFYARRLSWSVVEPRLIDLYVALVSEDDLRALLRWYKTPLGQRVLAVAGVLDESVALITDELLFEHADELGEILGIEPEPADPRLQQR